MICFLTKQACLVETFTILFTIIQINEFIWIIPVILIHYVRSFLSVFAFLRSLLTFFFCENTRKTPKQKSLVSISASLVFILRRKTMNYSKMMYSIRHTVVSLCHDSVLHSFIHFSVNMMACVQSVGSLGVIWPRGAAGSRWGDKGSWDSGVWRKAGLVWGPGWSGQWAHRKSIK